MALPCSKINTKRFAYSVPTAGRAGVKRIVTLGTLKDNDLQKGHLSQGMKTFP